MRQLKYDFVVAPGSEPKVIALVFEGAGKLEVDAQGDLVLAVNGGELRLRKPLAYQEVDGSRKPVAAKYGLESKNRVGVQVAAYDRTQPLIIDPVLVYSTYLGGSGADIARGIAPDPVTSGTVYVAGETASANFPTTGGSFQPTFGKGADCFVAKFDTSLSGATSRVYASYLGGSGTDQCYGVAVDSSHNAYIVGRTTSTNFPLATKLNGNNRGGSDAIVAKLNATQTGSVSLLYSTYLGGSGADHGRGIATDSVSAYVTGQTASSDLFTILSPPSSFDTQLTGPSDAFVARVDTDASSGHASVAFFTYRGGSPDDSGH